MRKRIIWLSLMLLATPSSAISQSKPVVVTEVPFSLLKGYVVVEATMKGKTTVPVVLATGTEHSFIDPRMLKQFDLTPGFAADGPVTGRNDKTFAFVTVNNVRVGESKARDLHMRLGPTGEMSKNIGQEIFAILGADFFKDQIVQFDFKNKVVRFFDKLPPELTDTTNPNFNAKTTTILRMAPKPHDRFQPTFLVPVVEGVLLNGQKTKLLFDSGIAAVVAISPGTAKKVGLEAATENGPPREEKVTLRLEANEFSNVPAWIYAKGTNAEKKLSEHGAVAGSLFLQPFIATFDYKKSVVVLERF